MDIKKELLINLQNAGMTAEEAVLYTELAKEPMSHLQLSRRTSINRTKVYRLIANLQLRGLVATRSDDRGKFLIASDPSMLNLDIAEQERQLDLKKHALGEVTSLLGKLQDVANLFSVYTYEGPNGMKQMQWHELQAKGEVLVLGNTTVEELVDDREWSERFRARTAGIGYRTREIINRPYENPQFSDQKDYMELYSGRMIPFEMLPIETPIIIYNDTVSIYYRDEGKKFGVEIVSAIYASTMRHIFEHYWELGTIT